jgi:hypothetical protein
MREAKGDLELEDQSHVPYLRLTPQLFKCLDFTPFEDKEGLWERRGSLDERHRERVRSVDQLEEEWEGTGSSHPSGMGKDWGQLGKVPSKGGKSYQSKQEGDWWQVSHPRGLRTSIASWRQLSERPTPGDIKVNQLRDNRSRHQFGERVVTILSWNRAAMKGIGHICTTFRLETQTYVLVMRSLGDQVFPTVGY